MDTEMDNPKISPPKISPNDNPRKRLAKHRPKEYAGSRWAGLILLIITFIISLFFYVRGGLGDFLSAVFAPARYSIQK